MTGEMLVNGVDVYREFGVTPLRGTFDEVMKPVSAKKPLAVEIENEDGEEVYFPGDIALLAARDFTIPLAIVAYNSDDFFAKKLAFERLLRTGAFLMFFPKVNFGVTCYFSECNQYTQLEGIQIGATKRVSAVLNLKLREPNPANRQLTKETFAYGVVIDESIADPTLGRIGNDEMAKAAAVNELAIQGTLENGYLKRFKKDNGLQYEDGTTSIVDGSAGDVVSHMPDFYVMVETISATKHNVWVSPYPIPGFYKQTGFTIGSFKAAVNNASIYGAPANALWSVMNPSATFRGGNNDATNDALAKGYLQKARTLLSRTQFRAYAQNRGANYGMMDWNAHNVMMLLFMTKYATLNSQLPVSAPVNGFYAGGLGDGLSTVVSADWSAYNGYYPLAKIGQTLSKGLVDGEMSYTLSSFNAAGDLIVKLNSFMGIENPFGDIWEWIQGINIWKQTVAEGDQYLALLYALNKYADDTTGYDEAIAITKNQGWLKSVILQQKFSLLAKEVGGSSSTYFSDYFYNDTGLGLWGFLRSGDANYGAYDGLACASANSAPSNANTAVGSRLGFYGRVRPGL